VNRDVESAILSGVHGTPTFVVNSVRGDRSLIFDP
jgi:protein-disulfide isomerase